MTGHAVFSLQNSEFNEFLFAEIGPERNESLLTVLSALARAGLDPWQEAARLSRQTSEAAIEPSVPAPTYQPELAAVAKAPGGALSGRSAASAGAPPNAAREKPATRSFLMKPTRSRFDPTGETNARTTGDVKRKQPPACALFGGCDLFTTAT